MMTLQRALDLTTSAGLSATLIGDGRTGVDRVHTDTRTLQPGDLFVALKGEHFDANDFLSQALQQGASAAIAHHGLAEAGLPGLEVHDTRLAIASLAKAWRAQFVIPMVAVAGSNGKTTVTQMIASVFRAWQHDDAFATEGNLNNDIGVPLTLLRLRQHHRLGVVELGMNHPGEIAFLGDLAKPTIALVNNAQREHLEFMVNVDAVARENGAVIASLDAYGTAVFPAGDEHSGLWRELAGSRKVLTFGIAAPADITAKATWFGNRWDVVASTPVGSIGFSLEIAGWHNVKNALAAVACAVAAGVPATCISAGLTAFLPVKGRSRAVLIECRGHALTLIDDTYNANPDSMRAAIEVLASLAGPRLLVMGDMGEVGDLGPQFHEEAGRLAHQRGIEKLFTLGEQSAGAASGFGHGVHFADMATLKAAVLAELPGVGSLLVKGSRFMKMEQVVQAITDDEKKQKETI